MKLCFILSAVFMFIVSIAEGSVAVITKSQLPAVFRSPANFDMQSEQWAVKAASDNILLYGGELRGTLYAAYHFLEDVNGVHWWTPWGEETVPASMGAIANTLCIVGNPTFEFRENYVEVSGTSPRPFYARNRSNGSITFLDKNYGWNKKFGRPATAHTLGPYVQAAASYADHPEYYALVGGQRKNTQLCMRNQNVFNIVLTQLHAYIDEDEATAAAGGHPVPMYDISANDNQDYCQCTACSSFMASHSNAPSAPYIDFVNRLSSTIKSYEHDVTLTTLAYEATETPPANITVDDNVIIRIGGLRNNLARKFDSNDATNAVFRSHLQGWSNIAKRIYLWQYQKTFSANAAHNFITTNLAQDLSYSGDYNVKGVFLEHENDKFPDVSWEFDTWASLKLMETPALSFDTLLSTFCNGYYGTTAGPAIINYMNQIKTAAADTADFHAFDSTVPDYSYINCAFVTEANGYWNTASGATGDQLTRVKNARLGFDRYVLHAGQRLIDEYAAAHSGSVSGFSTNVINLNSAATRSSATLNSLPTNRFPASAFTATVINAEKTAMTAFASYFPEPLDSSYAANPVLPTNIGIPRFVYYPKELKLVVNSNSCVMSEDTDGQARHRRVVLMDWPTSLATAGGVYNWGAKTISFRFAPAPIVPVGDSYNWYALGTGTISPTDYMYLLPDWHVQLHYGNKVRANGSTNGTFWAELRRPDADHVYLNRIAIVFNN